LGDLTSTEAVNSWVKRMNIRAAAPPIVERISGSVTRRSVQNAFAPLTRAWYASD